MATSEQILSLIKSHIDGDNDRFRTLALQLSVAEAKAGHAVFSKSIKDLLSQTGAQIFRHNFRQLSADMSDLLIHDDDDSTLLSLVVNINIEDKIRRIILEYAQKERLHQYNLDNRHRILLHGPSGTGKTMTASVIANELRLPLYIVRLEKVVTKFMGETSLKLSKIFDYISQIPGIYLFDEFDAIGQQRGSDNEVGEMRRVLNTFLQMMDRDISNSIVIAATNDCDALDKALFRRFDDVIEYSLPEKEQIGKLIANVFCDFDFKGSPTALSSDFIGMSCADIVTICKDAIKMHILDNIPLNNDAVRSAINGRNLQSKIG